MMLELCLHHHVRCRVTIYILYANNVETHKGSSAERNHTSCWTFVGFQGFEGAKHHHVRCRDGAAMQHFIEGEAAPGRWHLHGWQAGRPPGQAGDHASALQRAIGAIEPIAASVTLYPQAAGAHMHARVRMHTHRHTCTQMLPLRLCLSNF